MRNGVKCQENHHQRKIQQKMDEKLLQEDEQDGA
jgi:hypothetical protein